MNRVLYRVLWVFLLFGCISSCEYRDDKQVQDNLVVATTGMIGDALLNILPDEIEVHVLMGPGVDPHLYEPLPSDVRALARAKVVVYNGLHLEGKMNEVLHKLDRYKRVITWSDGLSRNDLIPIDEHRFDPHIWLDPFLWMQGIGPLTKELQSAYPSLAEEIEENAKVYWNKIQNMANQMKSELSNIPAENRVLITSHDAFSYFGRAFDVDVQALQGVSTVGETGLRRVEDLADFIVEKTIKAVFIESSVSTKSVNALQESCYRKNYKLNRGGTLYSDALGDEQSGAHTYLGMLEKNTNTIVNGLK